MIRPPWALASMTGLAGATVTAALVLSGPLDLPMRTRQQDATFAMLDEPDGPEPVVTSLRTGGIEQRAGMRVGDAVVAIDGLDHPSLRALRHHLADPGPISLRIRRGGDELPIHLLSPPAGELRGKPNPLGGGR